MPFGHGKKYLGNANRPLDYLIGGFQINTTTTWQSGLPFSTNYNDCSQDNDVGICRVIKVGSVSTGGGRNNYFTTLPFDALSANGAIAGPYLRPGKDASFGDHRNDLTGPGFFTTDLALAKGFRFTERFNGQFRLDAYNVFNHVNLGQPNGCVDCNGAGTISSLASNANMRRLQFGLRLEF